VYIDIYRLGKSSKSTYILVLESTCHHPLMMIDDVLREAFTVETTQVATVQHVRALAAIEDTSDV
jgi:hypothetical protein